jgi:hypothetical protein
MGMAENQNLIDQTAELHHTLNNACRKWGAWESRLRYLLKPSLNRWISEALIEHHRVIEKIHADIPAGELTLLLGGARDSALADAEHGELQRSADCPQSGRYGNRRAIKAMCPLKWRAPRNG